MKKMLAVVLSFVVLALTGCGQDTPPNAESAKTEPAATSAISFTDIAGREVKLDKPAQKVILTLNFEEYFAVTGEEGVSKVVGWSEVYWKGRRQATLDAFIQKYPSVASIPDVGYFPTGTFNVETAISLNPDLVIMGMFDFESAQKDLARLEAAGIAVMFVDYHEQTLENHRNSTLILGKAMGVEGRAQELADFYEDQMNVVTDRLQEAGEDIHQPKIYLEASDKGGPAVFGPSYGQQMWGHIIKLAKGDNIAWDLIPGINAPLAPEQVLAANPDIIVFTGNHYEDSDIAISLGYAIDDVEQAKRNLAAYRERAGWSDLNAVKNNKLYALQLDLCRHIFDFAGMQYIAKVLHPELFEDVDPDQNLREFHERFYPIDYTGLWFVDLAN